MSKSSKDSKKTKIEYRKKHSAKKVTLEDVVSAMRHIVKGLHNLTDAHSLMLSNQLFTNQLLQEWNAKQPKQESFR